MSDVVDLNQKRLDKAIEKSGMSVLSGPPPPGATVVSVLGCAGCGSTEFRLGHRDPIANRAENVVICANCCSMLPSLRWVDVTQAPLAT